MTASRPTSSARRLALVAFLALVAADLTAWGLHVRWRDARVADMTPIAEEIESLGTLLAEDDAWIARNTDLMQEYGQPERLAERVRVRGRRAAAFEAMIEGYDAELERLYRRFYLAPLPRPAPPFLTPASDRSPDA